MLHIIYVYIRLYLPGAGMDMVDLQGWNGVDDGDLMVDMIPVSCKYGHIVIHFIKASIA